MVRRVRVLLDTHILLWWLADDPQLTVAHRAIIADANNDVCVSAVTVAEIAIKCSLGKLQAPDNVMKILGQGGFSELPLTAAHAHGLRALPWHHRDPFDRMLVAQAQIERIPLLTVDARIGAYDVEML